MESGNVYYGVWINWTRGQVNGSTITLTASGAGFIVAFLAIFVSVAGGSLWRILAFLVHQYRITKAPRDGLYYQQQNILRNTPTPGVASWHLLRLISPWRKFSKRPFRRSLPLVLLALLNLSLFFVAGILVAEVTRTPGSYVLVRSPNCGNWTVNSIDVVEGLLVKTTNDTVAVANYARNCYGGPSNALECNQFPVQSLPYTRIENDPCPFAEGMCYPQFPPVTFDTGNLSSHDHLGINSRMKDRISYRKKTTCAPVIAKGFTTSMNYTESGNSTLAEVIALEGDPIVFYNYGPRTYLGDPRSNFTIYYNERRAFMGTGYEVRSIDYNSGDSDRDNVWHPDKSLLRNDADISMVFISANNILYRGKVNDPIFNATMYIKSISDNGKNISLYSSNYFVKPLACIDQHQFCNPNNQKCGKLDSYSTAVRSAQQHLDFNPFQYNVVSTMSLHLVGTTISGSIADRGSAALRAQEKVSLLSSPSLPKDQWKIEVEYWYAMGLARIQKGVVEYATGPTNVLENTYIAKPNDEPSRQLCNNMKTKAPPGSGAVSFSTLGVAIIIGLGGLIIIVHIILEYAVTNVVPTRNTKLIRWAIDDKLQLQRLAFEGAHMGTWKSGIGAVPTTTNYELFGMEITGKKEHPTISALHDEEKNMGAVSIDSIYSTLTPAPSNTHKKNWYAASPNKVDSHQIPPIRLYEGDEEIWPLVDQASTLAPLRTIWRNSIPSSLHISRANARRHSYSL